jgi:hypothetical protein
MSLSSLPKFPNPPRPGSEARVQKSALGLTPRATRVLVELGFIAVFGVAFYVLRQAAIRVEHPPAPEPAPAPLAFDLIEKRFPQVPWYASRAEVVKLLGPPSDWALTYPEAPVDVPRWDYEMGMGKHRIWYRWNDPANKEKWILILFADDKAYFRKAGPGVQRQNLPSPRGLLQNR